MNASSISFENGIFPARKLSEFKGVELKENEFLVRKIEKGTGKDSLGCIVPAASQEDFVSALEQSSVFNAAMQWYQGAWNDYLKEKLEEGVMLYKSDLELNGFISWLEAEEVKQGRISKERIGAWFDAEVATTLKRAFTEKLGNIENDKMLEILKSYKAQFMNLAKREITIAGAVKTNLEKAISLLPDSGMKKYCTDKINAASEKSADLMAL